MRRRKASAVIPPHLAAFNPADWDGDDRHRRSQWLEARAEWAEVNAPGLWPDWLAELLRFPV